jgi:predicted transcriptional regulator
LKMRQGVRFRAIYPRSYLEKVKPTLDSDILRNAQFKALEEVRLVVCATDAFAYFCLPKFGERGFDRTSFMFGSSSSFMRWCGELFDYYWRRSVPK